MDTLNDTTTKRCPKCGEWKPREGFTTCRSKRDGLQSNCKTCRAESDRKYRAANKERVSEHGRKYRAANSERLRKHRADNADRKRAYDREYRAATSEKRQAYASEYYAANADRIKARSREYYAANKDHVIEYRREYYAANAERIKGHVREYYDANKERIGESRREYNRWYHQTPAGKSVSATSRYRRVARQRESGEAITADDLAAIRAAQTDKRGRLICWRCGNPIKGTPHLDHWIPLAKGGTNDAGNLHYMHARCNLSKSAKHPTELGRLI